MKREELPGFVRELPITILTILILAVILAHVFSPIYRHYKKKAEGNRSRDAQEMLLPDESVEDAPGNVDKSETNEDSDDYSE